MTKDSRGSRVTRDSRTSRCNRGSRGSRVVERECGGKEGGNGVLDVIYTHKRTHT